MLGRAREAGVGLVITIGSNSEDTAKCLDLERSSGGLVRVAAALEPYLSADAELEKEMSFLEENSGRLVALGETGLDAAYPASLRKQEIVLRAHMQLAAECDLPLVIHARGAEETLVDIMAREGVPWVWHFFTRAKWLQPALDAGAVLSLPSIKSRELEKIARKAPIGSLVCETDSPAWGRNEGNEPSKVASAYRAIAVAKEMELEEVSAAVESNVRRVFKL